MNIHEELRAKITKTGFIGLQIGKEPNEVIYDWKTSALCAVVELPMEAQANIVLIPNYLEGEELRRYLYELGYKTAMNKVIQAIEKELG